MDDAPDLTRDAFLNGRVQAWQPKSGYRAGADAVLLASAVRAVAGQDILELGCGVGVASLCLAKRVDDLRITGVERDDAMAKLARRNALEADISFDVVAADIEALPQDIRDRNFDQVLMNPPYFGSGTQSEGQYRSAARHVQTPLATWVDVGIRRLKPGGEINIIHKPEALDQLLAALQQRTGAIEVFPIAGREGRAASRIILRARKNARAALVLHAPLVLHAGSKHIRDGENHSEAADALLRAAKSLDEVMRR